MARYRIVCTTQEPQSQPHDRAHIVKVGIGNNPDRASSSMTLTQVLSAMDDGDTFFTKGPSTGKVAEVRDYICDFCRRRHIKSDADATTDNNLDKLRRCVWS